MKNKYTEILIAMGDELSKAVFNGVIFGITGYVAYDIFFSLLKVLK